MLNDSSGRGCRLSDVSDDSVMPWSSGAEEEEEGEGEREEGEAGEGEEASAAAATPRRAGPPVVREPTAPASSSTPVPSASVLLRSPLRCGEGETTEVVRTATADGVRRNSSRTRVISLCCFLFCFCCCCCCCCFCFCFCRCLCCISICTPSPLATAVSAPFPVFSLPSPSSSSSRAAAASSAAAGSAASSSGGVSGKPEKVA